MAAIPSISHLDLIALDSSVLASFLAIFILLWAPISPLLSAPRFPHCATWYSSIVKKSIQRSTTYRTGSMAMTTGHVQMCGGSDRRPQQAPTPTDV